MPRNDTYHRKHLGQVFLRDPQVIDQILLSASLTPEDSVLEIGPGQGALTRAIAPQVAMLYALEIDAHFVQTLQQRFAAMPHIQFILADARRYDYAQLPQPLIVMGNLPYSTGTHILRHLFSYRQRFSHLVVMLQKEVSRRLVATPGSSAYSGISVFFQYHAKVQSCFDVPSHAFTPRPAVDSMVLRLDPYPSSPWPSSDEDFLFRLIRCAFVHRRKTLRKNLLSVSQWQLTNSDLDRIWETLALSRTVRPQELAPPQFVTLAAAIAALLPR